MKKSLIFYFAFLYYISLFAQLTKEQDDEIYNSPNIQSSMKLMQMVETDNFDDVICLGYNTTFNKHENDASSLMFPLMLYPYMKLKSPNEKCALIMREQLVNSIKNGSLYSDKTLNLLNYSNASAYSKVVCDDEMKKIYQVIIKSFDDKKEIIEIEKEIQKADTKIETADTAFLDLMQFVRFQAIMSLISANEENAKILKFDNNLGFEENIKNVSKNIISKYNVKITNKIVGLIFKANLTPKIIAHNFDRLISNSNERKLCKQSLTEIIFIFKYLPYVINAEEGKRGMYSILLQLTLWTDIGLTKLMLTRLEKNCRPPCNMEDAKYYGLVVGIDEYEGDWSKLNTCKAEAKDLKGVLEKKYNFANIDFLSNKEATFDNINQKISDISDKIKSEKCNSNVVVFFSGHGELIKNRGYFVPYDCTQKGNKQLNKKICYDDLGKYWDNLLDKSQHILFITDACESGAATKGTKRADWETQIPTLPNEKATVYERYYAYPSVEYITASARNEKANQGVVARNIIQILEENKETFMSSSELFSNIKKKTTSQHPQSDLIRGEGEFIFNKTKN